MTEMTQTQEVTRIKLLNKDAKVPLYATATAAGCDFYSTEEVRLEPTEVVGLKMNPFFKTDEPISVDNPYYLVVNFKDETAEQLSVQTKPVKIASGVAIQLQPDEELELRSRSGLGVKLGILAYNGTIDSDYTGEIVIKLWNTGLQPFVIEKGSRIAQGIIKKVIQRPFEVVEELNPTERGDNGFGSTKLK